MRNFILMLLILVCEQGFSQHVLNMLTSSEGRIIDKNISSPFSHLHNSASLGFINSFSIGAGIEKKYMINEMSSIGGSAQIPFKQLSAGIAFYSSGLPEFSSKMIAASFGKKLSEKFALGITFNHRSFLSPGIMKAGGIGAGLSSLMKVNDKWITGFTIDNLIRPYYTEGKEMRARRSVGLINIYRPSGVVDFFVSWKHEEGNSSRVNAGADYCPLKQVIISGGYISHEGFWMMAGFKKESFVIECGSRFHPMLGLTPAVFISMVKSENK